jgi:hypothetical protein
MSSSDASSLILALDLKHNKDIEIVYLPHPLNPPLLIKERGKRL